jgi:hypothetical protein
MASPFYYMLTYNTLFEHELKKIILAEIERVADVLANGSPIDYAEYKQQVGRIQGLRAALDYCDEASSIISKR